ncbi:MAG: hypothetical protein Q7T70_05990 [Polaromonas sp.]|nr:hypothetical protein [Polaromonas sp.]
MSKNLVDALNGGAWSVSAVIFDLNDMLDDEGRPISERRANAAVRAGVEMDMRECPYAGIRHGRLMNTSALAQVSHHYNPVMGEIAAFRRQTAGKDATWSDILAAILDPLARPAVHLLQQRNARGPVPAQVAVGHKLAAGFFGVMRTLHERLALGADLPVSTEAFLDLVEETGALVGPAEACAGSPQMLRKASTVLVEGGAANEATLDQARLDMARCLGQQVQLGIFWQLYDRRHVWELIRGETRQRLIPCNIFLVRKLERAVEEVSPSAPPRPDSARLPAALDADVRYRLSDALRDAADPQVLQEDRQTAELLLGEAGSAIRYEGAAAPFALQVARYLHAHRLFVTELCSLERRLRALLGFPAETPIRLGETVFPTPQALPWYELVLGRRIGESGHLTGSSAGVRVPVQTE